ncbi:MAG: aminotransferase class V-fold PLP-dependent enzyme [Promethearchaeota archaeon]
MRAIIFEKVRDDFPVLQKEIDDKPIIYLDSACVALRPKLVIEAINHYYCEYSACGGRTLHKLGMKVTEETESARTKIKNFINAKHVNECVFTVNTTTGINMVARGLDFSKNDLVITEDYAHNSNVVPWQLLEKQQGITHCILDTKEDGIFTIETLDEILQKSSASKKLVSFCHTSNITGYTIPAAEIIKVAHEHEALVHLDAAQSVPHQPVDVQKLDADFISFSLHKMCGPSGIGILYGKSDLFENLNPSDVGGGTVSDVTKDESNFVDLPARFEAGLQNYAGIIGAGATIDYLEKLKMKNIYEYEKKLSDYLFSGLKALNFPMKILGPDDPTKRVSLAAIAFENKISAHVIGMILDENNIFARSGRHCTHLWHNKLKIHSSLRPSLYFYNTIEEIDKFLEIFEAGVRRFL